MNDSDLVDGLPGDLIPLPTAPYDERPVSLPLDVEECRTAIWIVRGNISKAAELLKTSSARLRRFIEGSPYLSAELKEAKDRLVDIAEDVVYEALTDGDDPGRKDSMARFVLGSQGRSRGWGTGAGPSVNIKNSHGGVIRVAWADGTSFGEPAASHQDLPAGSSNSGEREAPPERSPAVTIDMEKVA